MKLTEKQHRGIARHERLHGEGFDHPLREALEARSFWRSAVLNDPDAGFAMLDARGAVMAINDLASEIVLGIAAAPLHGLRLHDILATPLASERMVFLQRVLRTSRTLLVDSVWRGVRCRERWQLLPGDAGNAGHCLWIIRRSPIPWASPIERDVDTETARVNDWGPLSVLSDHERKLLGMIGSGMGSEDIAAALDREPSQIAREKAAIRRKLGSITTAAMVRMAIVAGLVKPNGR